MQLRLRRDILIESTVIDKIEGVVNQTQLGMRNFKYMGLIYILNECFVFLAELSHLDIAA